MPSEATVMTAIKKRLDHYQFAKVVVWWTRLQSFKIKHFGNWIHGCPKGTPDFVCIVRNKDTNLTCLFLEAKSDTGKLRKEQMEFKDKYQNDKDVIYCTITSSVQIDSIMLNFGIDTTNALPESVGM